MLYDCNESRNAVSAGMSTSGRPGPVGGRVPPAGVVAAPVPSVGPVRPGFFLRFTARLGAIIPALPVPGLRRPFPRRNAVCPVDRCWEMDLAARVGDCQEKSRANDNGTSGSILVDNIPNLRKKPGRTGPT